MTNKEQLISYNVIAIQPFLSGERLFLYLMKAMIYAAILSVKAGLSFAYGIMKAFGVWLMLNSISPSLALSYGILSKYRSDKRFYNRT